MPQIVFLCKPASGACNLRCGYCFYADETQKREQASYGMMTLETLEALLQKGLEHADGFSLLFQGGEPTLRGLDFYRELIRLEQKWNTKGVPVQYSIQTNGVLLDEEWARFLAKNHFLVGLSLDGTPAVHDRWRLDAQGEGTSKSVLQAAHLLEQHQIPFNILTVVTAQAARRIDSIYDFYKSNGLKYQQYIPCLDPWGEPRGGHVYSLTPAMYGKFLKRLFDRWYKDLKQGNFVYNRMFENYVGILRGLPPESCGMAGQCARQLAVEADGSVYPCDFYVLDAYCIGNLNTDSLEKIEENREKLGFVKQSCQVDPRCRSCPWLRLCRGGCRRDRETFQNGRLSRNAYCSAYEEFFRYAAPRLLELAGRTPTPKA